LLLLKTHSHDDKSIADVFMAVGYAVNLVFYCDVINFAVCNSG